MKISEAFSRIRFTISKRNKPNEKDTEAFNVLAIHFKKTEETVNKENLLFAKLYAFLLENFIINYGNADLANKELNRILSEPMENRIHMLLMQLRHMELTQVIPDPLLANLLPSKAREKLAEYPKIEKDFFSAWEFWDEDNVISHLNRNINLSIQKYKNEL